MRAYYIRLSTDMTGNLLSPIPDSIQNSKVVLFNKYGVFGSSYKNNK